jgi:hypothetical protein
MPDADRSSRLAEFTGWVAQHVRGDEKGEAQVFLDRLFRAFGHAGVSEAGAKLEERVSKAEGKGKSFADLVWKPVVLVEMKKRGEDLAKHYRQAFDYWTRLVPGRPRYVVLSNFDEFWVYDFETQMDSPVDRVKVAELPTRYGALACLFPTPEKPVFGNDQVAVTRKAADHLADCFNLLTKRGVDHETAQRFVLQMLVALFSEDIGLLPRYMVAQLLEECRSRQDSYDLLGGLFDAMNTPGKTPGGRFAGVEYFNGGLFAVPARLELRLDEVSLLKAASKEDWSKVRPEIFGTLFEHSLGQEKRHAYGAHFTHPTDIMKIVGPTIVEPWREQIEGAKSLKRLAELRQRMQTYTVLDPACGSGNFLYTAYRELKRLEARLFERMTELSGRHDPAQGMFGFVTARQFYGLDINPFAVELAKVTMMIARKLAVDELHVTEPVLPLDNLDENFRAGDALIDELGNPTQWPRVDVIIGNPPFLGSRYLAKERGYDYARTLQAAYPQIPKMADYCVYWFRKAHEALAPCTKSDPLAGRAGLVGTQNVRNGESRAGGLDYITADGTIVEAVDNQPWSGEANVHVSIANWVKSQRPALLPSVRRLWFKVEPDARARSIGAKAGRRASKDYELSFQETDHINASLSADHDVSSALSLRANTEPKVCYVGQYPFNEGFLLAPDEARRWVHETPRDAEVLFPYMIGRDLVEDGLPSRWIIDFGQRPLFEAMSYKRPFERVQELVMPTVLRKAKAEQEATGKESTRWTRLADRWWQFRDYQPGTMRAIARIPRYIVCSRVTKRPIFAFAGQDVHPDNTLMVFPLADDYSFGILQSAAHWLWFVTKCSKLKSDFRYTPESVFNTFPWPQSPTVAQIDAVAEAGREVRRVRAEALKSIKGGLRAVYRTLELPGKNPLKDAHDALDAAVLAAYGFHPKDDLLAQLLALNLEVARREESGESVTAPGIPPGYPDPARLITDDCIRAS